MRVIYVVFFIVGQDKLNVEAFPDPKVQGVTLYLSDFTRPVADKLMNGDMFSGKYERIIYYWFNTAVEAAV